MGILMMTARRVRRTEKVSATPYFESFLIWGSDPITSDLGINQISCIFLNGMAMIDVVEHHHNVAERFGS